MSDEQVLRQIMRDKQLATVGDAFVNFVYSLALTNTKGKPEAVKVSDRTLADALRRSGLREHLGTRVSRKELANASESLLFEAYRRKLLTIEESVETLSTNPDGLDAGLCSLLTLAADRVIQH